MDSVGDVPQLDEAPVEPERRSSRPAAWSSYVSVDRDELASDAVTLLLPGEACGVRREAVRPTRTTQHADARSHHPCRAPARGRPRQAFAGVRPSAPAAAMLPASTTVSIRHRAALCVRRRARGSPRPPRASATAGLSASATAGISASARANHGSARERRGNQSALGKLAAARKGSG